MIKLIFIKISIPWRQLRAEVNEKIQSFRGMPEVGGLELCFAILLLRLRFASVSYTLKSLFPKSSLNKGKFDIVELYAVLEFVVLLILVFVSWSRLVETIIATYILFEIFLSLLNIIFTAKIYKDRPLKSVERSLLLLFGNVLDVLMAFTLFYRDWLGLCTAQAFLHSVLVLGTIGYPEVHGLAGFILVPVQVLLDLILLLVILSSFIGQLSLFKKNPKR